MILAVNYRFSCVVSGKTGYCGLFWHKMQHKCVRLPHVA